MSASWYTEGINNNNNMMDVNTLQSGHDVSPYPGMSAAGRVHHPVVLEADLQGPSLPYTGIPESYFNGRSSQTINMGKVHGASHMYICCKCGDGPKVYKVQPRCVECNHIACSYCREVK